MSSNSEPAKLFSDQNKMYKQFGDQLGSVMASVETLSEAIVNSDTYPGDKKADLQKMLDAAKRLALVDVQASARGSICWSIRTKITEEARQNCDGVNEPEEYARQLSAAEQKWTGASPAAMRDNLHVKAVEKDLASAMDGSDDEVLMEVGGGEAKTCPIMFTSDFAGNGGAYINQACGHTYCLNGILGFFVQGGSRSAVPKDIAGLRPDAVKKCPVAGCSHNVTPSGLQKDYRTQNCQKLAQRRAATQGSEDDDDDVEVL